MIEVKGLVKYYGERKVLHGLDFSVGVGRVCGFLGPNGSGKSTTMDVLAGLLGPSAGDVKICGFDVVEQVKDVKSNVGYLPDNPPLYREMTVRDFLEYCAKLRGLKGAGRKAAVDKVLEDCDVTDVTGRVIGNLSKGYRQRVALCSALVHQPQVLILDEPTEGLDPNQIVHIRKLIKKLSKDRTVILSSHILSEVQATCDDVVIINQGVIAARTSLDAENAEAPAYVFRFTARAEEAVAWFRERNFVASATHHVEGNAAPHGGAGVLVHFQPEFWRESKLENVAKLNTLLVQAGYSVSGISEQHAGIESLFFNVIKSHSTAETVHLSH